MVEAPPDWAGSVAASTLAETKDDIPAPNVDEHVSSRPPRARRAESRQYAKAVDARPDAVDDSGPSKHERWRDNKDADSAKPNVPILPGDQWTSDFARRRQQIVLFCVAGASGLVMAIALFAFIAIRWSKPGTTDSPVVDLGANSASSRNDDSEQPPIDDSANADTALNATSDLDEQPPKVDPLNSATTDDTEGSGSTADDTSVENTKNDTGTLLDDAPPDLVPREDLKSADSADPSSPKSLLDGLGTLLDDKPFDAAASETSADMAALSDGRPADFIPLPRPEPREIDVAARLADSIPGIVFEEWPLDQTVRFISDMSTIPITLDPEALIQVKAAPNSKVSIRQTDTTVGDALQTMLSSLDLSFVVEDSQLLVTLPLPPDSELRETTYRVDDLVENGEELAALGEMLTPLLESDSLENSANSDMVELRERSIILRGSEATHFDLLTFCEKLRVARGLTPRSDYEEARFDLTTRTSNLRETLSKNISLNYIQPTRLVEILQRITAETGVSILIDWQALATIQWTPDAECTLTVSEQPLGEALRSLLEPMELAYRIVDGTTLQVTTPKAIASRKELEFYPIAKLLPDSAGIEDLVGRITLALGKKSDFGEIQIDPKSRCLIASVPQPVQVELEKLLHEWRDK